jgi:aryl-alcohol dehydrogenase-like predicted oxidoreductase
MDRRAEDRMQRVPLGRTGRAVSRIGLGAMPLSIQGRPEDRTAAKRVVRRAVELGITLIDTADVYCLDDRDLGHNERLIRESLDEVGVDGEVVIATKGGLTRPGGRWERDARPERLREACERSLAALRTDSIDLYQLHAPDPYVPFEDSMGELARLRQEGKVRAVGLSNVDLGEIRLAQGIVEIASVQNRYNPWDRSSEEAGLLAHCDRGGITFLPFSPVGGRRRVELLRADPELRRIGSEVGATPEELVLAWILSRSPSLVAIPGASRVASVESSARAEGLRLDQATLAEVERAFRTLPR